MTLRVSGPTPAVLEVALAWGRLAREGREVTEASIAEALLDARAAQATARAPAVETTPSPAPGPRPFGEEVTLPERPGVPTLEALRIGSDVLLRPTGAPWTRLAAHHERMGARLRVVLRSEIDPLEPRDRARVRWIEPSGPWEDADFVGRWSIQGSIPNAGGAIGWSREYALAADGTYQFSAYPARTADGRWRRVEGAAPRLLLDGAAETEVVGLIRDEQREPRTAGPLANGAVSVTQSDQAPPPESLVPPLATGPTEPPQTLRLELTTDAEGAVELPLEPWAVHVEVYDGAGRRVRFEL